MPLGGYYIEDISWSLDEQGEPFIKAMVDGSEVFVQMQQKSVLLDADIVLVFGDIESEAIIFNTTILSEGSGFVKSAILAIEVRRLTRAYEEGKVTTDPRFKPGL